MDLNSLFSESLDYGIMEKILASCHSLEKLTFSHVSLTPSMVHSICMQNDQTLQSLSLESCKGLSLGRVQQILEKCTKIEELRIVPGVNMSPIFSKHFPTQ